MRAVALSGVFIAAATCGDQGPAAPSNLEPGHAWFAVRPSFEAMPAGGPTIALSKITAVLTGPTGDVFNAEANFANGQAVLEFNVPVTGGAEEFTLNATAYDLSGQVAYTFTQKYTLKPGANNSLPSPTFKYSGLDAGLSSLKLTPATMTLAAGASASFAASGTIANGQSITPNVGWSSSDPSVATVNQSGSVTAGQSQGTATITATSVTGLAASASVKVTAPVAKVIATPASLQLIRGTAGNVSAELRDATNHVIDDRTAAWTSSDPSIATVSATGAVSAVKIGKATLTASAEGQSATVAVTVISPVYHLEVTPTD
ncbi:MAG: Ig-like domain-containing protein, partial [Gemmatimonadaceae bacterium]